MNKKEYSQYAIVIPVYNEERFVRRFLEDLFRYLIKSNMSPLVIVVDDRSSDSTSTILKNFAFPKHIPSIMLSHPRNSGKGAALRTGFEYAQSQKKAGVLFMDGDCQHDPKEIEHFFLHLQKVPLVFGYREFSDQMSFIRRLGNQCVSSIFRHFFVMKRRDPMCGYMAIRADVYTMMKWHSDDYGVEAEISSLAGKQKISFDELHISTIYLDKKTGLNFYDVFKVLFQLPFLYFGQRAFLSKVREKKSSHEPLLFVTVGCLLTVIYLLLAFKFTFRSTSLIGNLEPYPDALYYALPAWNFSNAKGFVMAGQQYQTKLITPPLYSIYLIPFFSIVPDVRVFYIANMLLGIGSVWIFLYSLKSMIEYKNYSIISIALTGFFFVTNFYVFSLPSLLMAENLTLFLTLLCFAAFTQKLSWMQTLLATFLPLGLMLTKFSNFPIAACFGAALLLKSFFSQTENSRRISLISLFVCNAVLFLLYLEFSTILVGHKNLQGADSFSTEHIWKNSQFYIQTLLGGSTRFLWWTERFASKGLLFFSSTGILVGLFSRRLRPWTIALSAYSFFVVAFMSAFRATDARYMLIVLPAILLFCGMSLQFLAKILPSHKFFFLFALILYMVAPALSHRPSISNLVLYKQQLGINFKHTQTPWNYLAVKEFDTFFETKNDLGKSYLITVLPDPYFSLFGDHVYGILPMTLGQEFISGDQNIRQKFGEGSLHEYFTKGIQVGDHFYVTNYYTNNLSVWGAEFDRLKDSFELEKVHTGCLESCNIYKLRPKSQVVFSQ